MAFAEDIGFQIQKLLQWSPRRQVPEAPFNNATSRVPRRNPSGRSLRITSRGINLQRQRARNSQLLFFDTFLPQQQFYLGYIRAVDHRSVDNEKRCALNAYLRRG